MSGYLQRKAEEAETEQEQIARLDAENEQLTADFARLHKQAEARIRELEAARELWKKSEEGTLAQMAETNERFKGALSTIRELEAQLAEAEKRVEELRAVGCGAMFDAHNKMKDERDAAIQKLADAGEQLYIAGREYTQVMARAEKAEAQLAEAEETLREKEDGQLARYWMDRFDKAEAKFDTAIQQLTLANRINKELAARAENAEAEAATLRELVKRVEWYWQQGKLYYCPCCNSEKQDGHKSHCELQSVLNPEGEAK